MSSLTSYLSGLSDASLLSWAWQTAWTRTSQSRTGSGGSGPCSSSLLQMSPLSLTSTSKPLFHMKMRRQTIKMTMSKVMMKLSPNWSLTLKQTGLEPQDLMPLARSPGSPSPPGPSTSPSLRARSSPPTLPSRGILLQSSLVWPSLLCGNLSFNSNLRRLQPGRKSSLSGLGLGRTGILPELWRGARRGSPSRDLWWTTTPPVPSCSSRQPSPSSTSSETILTSLTLEYFRLFLFWSLKTTI